MQRLSALNEELSGTKKKRNSKRTEKLPRQHRFRYRHSRARYYKFYAEFTNDTEALIRSAAARCRRCQDKWSRNNYPA